jgi:hypothetical protein
VKRLASPPSASFSRIGQAQGLGDLVEGLAGRVVDGGSQPPAAADAGHVEQLAMAAGHQQQQEGIGDVRAQAGRDGMTLQVVDRDQRQAARQGDRLARRQPDHHPAHQARPGGGRDPVEGVETQPGLGHGAADDGVDHLDMGARGDLRHHPAIGGVVGDLAGDD